MILTASQLTLQQISHERDLTIDEAGFEKEMAAQRQRARDAGKFAIDYNSVVKVEGETQFEGYDATAGQGQIIAIYKDGEQVDEVVEGDEALIVLNQTPFYAESGGQIGDTGLFKTIRVFSKFKIPRNLVVRSFTKDRNHG